MTTKAAAFTPKVDQTEPVTLTDPQPATTALLHVADSLAHALATGWGYPGVIMGLSIPTDASDVYVLAQIPPTVRYFRVGLLCAGEGGATVSAGTGDSTTLGWNVSGGLTAGEARWTWTSGLMDDSVGASEATALKLVVAQHWYPKNAIVTINPADAAGAAASPSGRIYAIALEPLWEDMST